MRGRESIKIAIIVWDLSISGGTQRQALELAHYLVRKDHKVVVFCAYLNRALCYPELLDGLEVHAMNLGDYAATRDNRRNWMRYPYEPLLDRESRSFASWIAWSGFKPDVLNPHDFQAYRTAYHLGKIVGAPSVWMVNDLPRSMIVPRPGWSLRKLRDLAHYYLFLGPFGYWTDRERIRGMDRCVVFDKPTAETFRKMTGVEPVRMPSGLDLNAFDYRPRKSRAVEGEMKILAVGVFFPHRRFEDIINAITPLMHAKVRPRVTIIGSEKYDPAYAQRIHNLAGETETLHVIDFRGEVTQSELRKHYAEADVFVFPNYPQTWGLAPFEAMASGTPTIVCTGAGASEILTHGENALLVPPGRPDEIARLILLLHNDSETFSRLNVQGRKFVEKNVSWDAYGQRMERLFEEAVARRKPK